MAEARDPEPHQRYVAYLLDRVRADRYPSIAMLDMLESGIQTDQERTELVDALLEKVEADRYPSMPMLARILRIAR